MPFGIPNAHPRPKISPGSWLSCCMRRIGHCLVTYQTGSRWWFEIFFISPVLGEDSHFD